jgi:hypothetical protein
MDTTPAPLIPTRRTVRLADGRLLTFYLFA